MARPRRDDTPILEAALMGLQHQYSTITVKMSEIRKQLGIRGGRPASGETQSPQRKRSRMSAAARKRIADATKKRWAAYRAANGEGRLQKVGPKPKAKAKRVLSPAARKRIADATRKRWAAFRKAKAAQG